MAAEKLELLARIQQEEFGLDTEDLCRQIGQPPQAIGDALEELQKSGQAESLKGHWVTPDQFAALSRAALTTLAHLHHDDPQSRFHHADDTLLNAGANLKTKAADRFWALLGWRVRRMGQGVALRDFRPKLPPKPRKLLDRVLEVYEAEVLKPPTPKDIAQAIGTPIQAVDEMIKLGLETGDLVGVGNSLYSAKIFTILVGHLSPSDPTSLGEFRDRLQIGRAQAAELLEWADEQGITRHKDGGRIVQEREWNSPN